jgi:hypothetical protein
MKSSKTHRNKAFILASVYSWLETFEKYAPYSTKINACRQHLRNFSNNAKHHSKYQLTPDFDEHSMICKGRFFTPKEYVVYIQWTISRFNALVDKIVQQQEEAEEEGEEYQVTVETGLGNAEAAVDSDVLFFWWLQKRSHWETQKRQD